MRYIFFYPSINIGGAQLLFARIAEALIKNGYNVLIIEQSKCFIHNYLDERNLKFDTFQVVRPNKFHLEQNDLLILPLSYIFIFRKFIIPHKDSRLFFWDLHPYNLVDTTAFSKIYKNFPDRWISLFAMLIERDFLNKMRRFVTVADKYNAIYFMSLSNFITNKKVFKLDIEPKFLQIPIEINPPTQKQRGRIFNNNNIDRQNILKIGWISRMDEDKVPILMLLIDDIILFNKKRYPLKIQLHAIGNGTAFNKIITKKNAIGDDLILPGILQGLELDKYLAENIDIGFSMGTAALEFASRKIATVLVPSTTCFKVFNKEKKRYLWLHDSFGYDVAVEKYHANRSKDFETIVNEFLEQMENLSDQSFNYISNNHSFKITFERFLEFTERSTLSYSYLYDIGVFNISVWQHLLRFLKNNFKRLMTGVFRMAI